MNKKTILLLTVFLLSFTVISFAGNTRPADKTDAAGPAVKITAEPAFGSAPLAVSFDASSFLYHYGEKLSFTWNFNDGVQSAGSSTNHTFSTAGTYAVELKVDTPFGEKYSWVFIIVQ